MKSPKEGLEPRGKYHREGDFSEEELLRGEDLTSPNVTEIPLSCGGRIIIHTGERWICESGKTINYVNSDRRYIERDLMRVSGSGKTTHHRRETIEIDRDLIMQVQTRRESAKERIV